MTRIPSSLVRLTYRIHIVDIVVGALAPILAVLLRETGYFVRADQDGILIYSAIATAATVFSVVYFNVTQILSRFFSFEDVKQIVKAAAAATLITSVLAFTLMRLDQIPRSMPLLHFVLLTAGLVGTRGARAEHFRRMDNPRSLLANEAFENVLLVGATRMATLYIRMLGCMPGHRQRIIAVLDDNPRLKGRSICGLPVVGGLAKAESVLTEYATHGVVIHRVVVTNPILEDRAQAEAALADICRHRAIPLQFMADHFDPAVTAPLAEADAREPHFTPFSVSTPYLRFRRVADVVLAGLGILFLSPLFLAVAIMVLIDVGAPVVFWQERVGRYGRPIFVHKFRTLRAPVDKVGRAIPEAARLSWIGNALRASRLDELPQLVDILRGEMSLIGPRPLLPVDMPNEPSMRLQVPPGVTGWAQVHGGKLIGAEEKNALDEWYIAHMSPRVDLRIIWRTVVMSLTGERRDESIVETALEYRNARLPETTSAAAGSERGEISQHAA